MQEGEYLKIIMYCPNCENYKSYSNSSPQPHALPERPELGFFRVINLNSVTGNVLAGGSFEDYHKKKQFSKDPFFLSETAYRRYEKAVLMIVRDCEKESFDEVAEELLNRTCLVLCGDGSWAQPRNSALSTYAAVDFQTSKVVFCVVVSKDRYMMVDNELIELAKGNYVGSSKGMEIVGLSKILEYLKQTGLFGHFFFFICDRDLSVKKALSGPEFRHITVLFDPGHLRKTVKKLLVALFGSSQTGLGFVNRILTWWLRCLKEAEEAAVTEFWQLYVLKSSPKKPDGPLPSSRYCHSSLLYSLLFHLVQCLNSEDNEVMSMDTEDVDDDEEASPVNQQPSQGAKVAPSFLLNELKKYLSHKKEQLPEEYSTIFRASFVADLLLHMQTCTKNPSTVEPFILLENLPNIATSSSTTQPTNMQQLLQAISMTEDYINEMRVLIYLHFLLRFGCFTEPHYTSAVCTPLCPCWQKYPAAAPANDPKTFSSSQSNDASSSSAGSVESMSDDSSGSESDGSDSEEQYGPLFSDDEDEFGSTMMTTPSSSSTVLGKRKRDEDNNDYILLQGDIVEKLLLRVMHSLEKGLAVKWMDEAIPALARQFRDLMLVCRSWREVCLTSPVFQRWKYRVKSDRQWISPELPSLGSLDAYHETVSSLNSAIVTICEMGFSTAHGFSTCMVEWLWSQRAHFLSKAVNFPATWADKQRIINILRNCLGSRRLLVSSVYEKMGLPLSEYWKEYFDKEDKKIQKQRIHKLQASTREQYRKSRRIRSSLAVRRAASSPALFFGNSSGSSLATVHLPPQNYASRPATAAEVIAEDVRFVNSSSSPLRLTWLDSLDEIREATSATLTAELKQYKSYYNGLGFLLVSGHTKPTLINAIRVLSQLRRQSILESQPKEELFGLLSDKLPEGFIPQRRRNRTM
jgi:hypothetical protein